jgi:hypothetical protein
VQAGPFVSTKARAKLKALPNTTMQPAIGAQGFRFMKEVLAPIAADRETVSWTATMPLLSDLKQWWSARRPKPLDQLLSVEFDSEKVEVRVVDRMDPAFNQTFRWEDIVRVCVKDGGLYSSDIMYIELRGRDKPAIVLTEAKGGSQFFGALCDRKFLPEEVWRRAMGETGGGTHCWPPERGAS